MSKLGERLDAARSAVHDNAPARRKPPLRSGCILCDLRLPVIEVDGVLHHEARHDGRSVTVPCTKPCLADRMVTAASRSDLAGYRPGPLSNGTADHVAAWLASRWGSDCPESIVPCPAAANDGPSLRNRRTLAAVFS
jgi:hypothetical protein